MKNNSQILYEAYETFILHLGEKLVLTPYRINIPADEHPARQGKSAPEVITEQVIIDAKEQNFDLEKANVEEIRTFMEKNNLGIDCSGFAYRLLDHLVQVVKGKPLTELGFEHVGKTNGRTLTSDEFSIPVDSFEDVKPGDLVKLDSEEEIPHVLVVLSVEDGIIIYAHSGHLSTVRGVHQDKIENGKLPAELSEYKYNISAGDGIRRLKILT